MNDRSERQGRAEAVAQQRRRRDDSSFELNAKLSIPEEVKARLEAEGRTARWVNDEGNRLYNLTVKDDYDKVDDVEPVPVGTTKEGRPIMAHLLSKPNDFIAADRAKAERRRKETEAGFLKGHVPAGPGTDATPVRGLMGADTYVVGSTSIGRGNQIIE